MKKIVRDIIVIAALLGVIALAPFVIDAMKGGETESKPEAQSTKAEDKPAEEPAGKPADKPEEKPQEKPKEEEASSSVTPIVPDKDCPDVSLGAQPGQAMSIVIDGGGGKDTLKTGGGEVALDGEHFSGLEVIDVRNGEANNVTIRGAGLVSLKGRHAYVIADKDIDTVLLDPCLHWNDPMSIVNDGPETLLRYDAFDNHGNVSYLSVTEGVKVEKAPRQ